MPLGLRQPRPAAEPDQAQPRAIWGLALMAAIVMTPTFALAYVGPGLGLGAIGSALSLVGAVFLGILGFLWYPIKRLLKVFRKAKASDE